MLEATTATARTSSTGRKVFRRTIVLAIALGMLGTGAWSAVSADLKANVTRDGFSKGWQDSRAATLPPLRQVGVPTRAISQLMSGTFKVTTLQATVTGVTAGGPGQLGTFTGATLTDVEQGTMHGADCSLQGAYAQGTFGAPAVTPAELSAALAGGPVPPTALPVLAAVAKGGVIIPGAKAVTTYSRAAGHPVVKFQHGVLGDFWVELPRPWSLASADLSMIAPDGCTMVDDVDRAAGGLTARDATGSWKSLLVGQIGGDRRNSVHQVQQIRLLERWPDLFGAAISNYGLAQEQAAPAAKRDPLFGQTWTVQVSVDGKGVVQVAAMSSSTLSITRWEPTGPVKVAEPPDSALSKLPKVKAGWLSGLF